MLCVVLAVVLDLLLVGRPVAAHAVDPGEGARMNEIVDAFQYIFDGANWQGDARHRPARRAADPADRHRAA